MNQLKTIILVCLCCTIMQPALAQEKSVSPFSVSATLNQTTFGLGAPLTVTIRVTNNTRAAVQGPEIGDTALTAEWIRFELQDENGKVVKTDSRPRSRWGRDPLPPEPGQTLISNNSDESYSLETLGPGKSFETKVLVTPWLAPPRPGRYILTARVELGLFPYKDPNKEIADVPEVTTEAQVPFTVEKMDRAKLLVQAKELAANAFGPDTSTYNQDALEA